MNQQQAATRFYLWLAQRGTVTKETAKRVARAFWAPYVDVQALRTIPAERLFFWPLVQSGVLSFVGGNQYRLSPHQNYQTLSGKQLKVNALPLNVNQNGQRYPGLEISDANTGSTDLHRFRLDGYLNKVPNLDLLNIVRSWESGGRNYDYVIREGKSEPRNRSNTTDDAILLKTTDEPGGKTGILLDRKVYDLPSSYHNPEAYPLAYLITQLLRADTTWQPISFFDEQYRVSINTKVFPTELRKLLFLESVTVNDDLEAPLRKHTYTLRPAAYQQFKQLMSIQL